MTRTVAALTLALGLLASHRRVALGQRPNLSFAAHAGYNFNDLNEPLLGGQATLQFTPFAAVNAGASAYLGVTGSLWMWHMTLRTYPLPRLRVAYVAVGMYQSRAANGTLRDTDTGFIGTLGAQSAGRLQLFGEFQFLKDGALSTQVLTGIAIRVS